VGEPDFAELHRLIESLLRDTWSYCRATTPSTFVWHAECRGTVLQFPRTARTAVLMLSRSPVLQRHCVCYLASAFFGLPWHGGHTPPRTLHARDLWCGSNRFATMGVL